MKRPKGIVFGSEVNGHPQESCDVCIVGSGPGGAVVADELTKAGRSVLMIEEGPLPSPAESMTPKEVVAKYYREMGLFTTHWPVQFPVFTGRVFGGTTVINSGTILPTPDRVMDGWASDIGVEFDRRVWRQIESEHDEVFSVKPCPTERMSTSNRLFAEGLERLGLPGGGPLPRCERDCEGSGRCVFICPKDAKQSVNLSLLPKSLERGMRVYVETRAVWLNKSKRKVKGVICRTAAGGELVVHAKTVVLAMGTLETALFMLRNGMGWRYPAVGRNLSIHPAAKVFAEMPEPVHSWKGVPQAYRYEQSEYPDVHFEGVFLPAPMGAIGIPFFGGELADWMRIYDRLAGFGFFISDSNHGRVRRIPGVGPFVTYRVTFRDLDNFCFALKLIARAYFAVGARRVLLPLLDRKNLYDSIESLDNNFPGKSLHPGQMYAMAFHPLGTCRFSATRDQGVVDVSGRCHRHDNLYIADGSAIAGPLHANPQMTIMTFARLVGRGLA
ncbi:MAG: GMC family oxidoreductase [Phycisphaerae bacterium]|nr:GMC family oxidoreductase [Phycisphaerae bacterium]